jgi:hypothetical protein
MEPRKTTARGTGTRARTTSGADEVVGAAGTPQAQQTASGGIAGKVKERATAQLSTQKDRATDSLGSVASAVRQTGQRLREEQNETVAQYVEKAADQLDRLSSSLREKDVTELLQDAQRLARRQPALFIGGSFAVGLIAARFLKSSRRDEAEFYPAAGAY